MTERKFARGLLKASTAAELRQTVSQVVRETAVANICTKEPIMSLRMSRIAFRKGLKREQRRSRRQHLAKQKAQEDSDALKLLQQDPAYLTVLADKEALILCREEEDRRVSEKNHKAWLEREQVAQFEFQKKRAKEEEAFQREREQRDKIRRELEDAEKRRKLIKEQKKKAEEEILRNHQIKLQEIRDYINDIHSDVPQSLLGTTETNPSAQECQYFKKTSVCRFGDKCSRKHVKAKLSSVLLVHNFFRTENFLKGHTLTTADEIIQNSLEVNREFNEFFDDVCAELEKFGQMINLLVCANTEKHMIGNVYVEFWCAKSALAACYQLNGRFYGGQKLVIEFCHNLNWRTAICGLSLNNKCSRGSTCNYLHVFRNPGLKYPLNINTIQSGTPSPAVNSLNTTERKETSWEEPQKEMINRPNWRWSVSPERREDNQKPEPLTKEPFKGEESTRSRSPTIRTRDSPRRHRHKEKGKKRKRSRSRSKSRSRHKRRHRSKHKK